MKDGTYHDTTLPDSHGLSSPAARGPPAGWAPANSESMSLPARPGTGSSESPSQASRVGDIPVMGLPADRPVGRKQKPTVAGPGSRCNGPV